MPQGGSEEQLTDEEGNPIDPGKEGTEGEGSEEGSGEEGGETPEDKSQREIWKTFPLDPETGYLKDPNTGALFDPETGAQVRGDSLLGDEEDEDGTEPAEGDDAEESGDKGTE